MKIQYSQKRNALVRRPTTATMVVVGIAVLVVLTRVLAPSFFAQATAPLFSLGTALSRGVKDTSALFADRASLMAQRDAALAAENSLAAQNQTLAAQVADLTALLGTRAVAPPGILAGVLARPPVAAYDELVIAAGSAQGIAQGDPVFGDSGVPLGTISSVTTDDARATLYSAPGRQTSALVGASHTPVTLMGQGAGAFTASVPRDAGVAVGDAIYVTGPGSLAIGTVSAIDSDPSSPSSTLHIKPYVNPFSITWVTVSRAP